MSVSMTSEFPAPTGVNALYFGGAGGSTTRYYWIQAIYATGKSALQSSNALGSTLASIDQNNVVSVTWNSMAGAIGYNVFYTTSSTAPIGGTILIGTVTYPTFGDKGASNSPMT